MDNCKAIKNLISVPKVIKETQEVEVVKEIETVDEVTPSTEMGKKSTISRVLVPIATFSAGYLWCKYGDKFLSSIKTFNPSKLSKNTIYA